MLVFAEGEDLARHLGPDVDHFLGLHGAGGADGGHEIAPGYLDGMESGAAHVVAGPEPDAGPRQDQHQQYDQDQPRPLFEGRG